MNIPRLEYTSHLPNRSVPDKNRYEVGGTEVVYAKNFRMGNYNPSQKVATRYKITGNLEVFQGFLPEGFNIPCGRCTNDTQTMMYAAWYNSDGNHSIMRYSFELGVQVVIQDPILDFKQNQQPTLPGYVNVPEYLVTMDVNADILVWSDFFSDPRTIFVEKMIAGDLNVPLSNWLLSEARRPPAYPPLFDLPSGEEEYTPGFIADDGEKISSDFASFGVQFTCSYTLWDNSETRVGEFSQIWFNNKATVYLPQEEVLYLLSSTSPIVPSTFVKAVNVYYRRGNFGPILLLRRIENKQSSYVLINGSPTLRVEISDMRVISGSTVTPADIRSYFDAVPLKARQVLFSGSRLNWLNYIDNRDIIPCSISVDWTHVDQEDWDGIQYRTGLTSTDYEFGIAAFDKQARRTTILTNKTFRRESTSLLKILTPTQATSVDKFNSFFLGGDADIDSTNQFIFNLSASFPEGIPDWVDNLRFFAKQKLKKKLTFKGCARVVMCYSLYNEETGVKEFSYSPVISVNGVSFAKVTFEGIGFIMDENIPLNYSKETSYTIRIRRHFTYKPDENSSGRTAAFEEMTKEFTVTDYRDNVVVCRIKGADLDKFEIVNTFFPPSALAPGSYLAYNIPLSTDADLGRFEQSFSEIELYQTGTDPDTYYQIGTPINAAPYIGVVNPTIEMAWYGDAFMTRVEDQIGAALYKCVDRILATTGKRTVQSFYYDYWVACMNLCGPYIEDWNSDFGQPNVYAPAQQTQKIKPNYTRHSEQIIQGSAINGLFTVQESNETFMPLEFGDITIGFPGSVDQNTGNRIRIVCQGGCVSLYLDRTVLQNEDGTSNLIQNSLVYGTKNPMRDMWGASLMNHCTNTPEGLVFFLSERHKTLVQYSENGLADIPRQAQDRFVAALQNIDYGVAKVGVDPFYKEIVIALNGSGLAYNYTENAFQHERTYAVDARTGLWLYMGTRLFMFYENKIYEFNRTDGDGINRLFGQPFSADFTVVSNGAPKFGKVYKAIRMKSEVPWNARVITNSISENEDGDLVPRETTVTEDEYRPIETLWVGSICQDINSGGGKYSDGMDMKGYLAEVQFTTNDPTDTSVDFVEIGYFESNIQKR